MAASAIEWTEVTWNPTTGCNRISPGCDHCYAMTLAKRLKAMGQPKYQRDGDPRTSGPGFGLTVHQDTLTDPYSWSGSRLVFVNSMSDLFHDSVPDDFIRDVAGVIRETPQHTYQVLTKRSRRLRDLSEKIAWPANAWLGVSVENQRYADLRIPHLLDTRAAVRFLSCEPLLDQVDLSEHIAAFNESRRIDWVIVGGESGPRARPMDREWARTIRDQCTGAGIAFFFKQWGGRTPKAGGRTLDRRIWSQMPAHAEPVSG